MRHASSRFAGARDNASTTTRGEIMQRTAPGDWQQCTQQASASLDRTIRKGALQYDRNRHLPRVLPANSEVFAEDTAAGRRKVLARIARALRAERNRGRAGHWTYDLNRHIALAQAYAAERRRLGETTPKNTVR
jgi:hypothetical protein